MIGREDRNEADFALLRLCVGDAGPDSNGVALRLEQDRGLAGVDKGSRRGSLYIGWGGHPTARLRIDHFGGREAINVQVPPLEHGDVFEASQPTIDHESYGQPGLSRCA